MDSDSSQKESSLTITIISSGAQMTRICLHLQGEQIQTYRPSTTLALRYFSMHRKIIKKRSIKIVNSKYLKEKYGE